MREYILKIYGPELNDTPGRKLSGEFRFEADDFVAAIAEARAFHDERIESADFAELLEVQLKPVQTWKFGVAQGV